MHDASRALVVVFFCSKLLPGTYIQHKRITQLQQKINSLRCKDNRKAGGVLRFKARGMDDPVALQLIGKYCSKRLDDVWATSHGPERVKIKIVKAK